MLLGIKEGLVECATVCVTSVVILLYFEGILGVLFNFFSRLLNKKALEYVVQQFRDLDRTFEVRNTKLH